MPGLLDKARWEMEFLLRMQIPDVKPSAGMAHHKVHDDNWTGFPTRPDLDAQPRHLRGPSTAATLNLAATAPHRCYLDDIESYSTNEVAINWNSALVWTAAWLSDHAE